MAKAEAEKQDAIDLLKADHRMVEDLFSEFEQATTAAKKRKIAEQICLELTVHTQIEEEIFYPAVRGKIEEDLVTEAYVEHDGAKALIIEIEGTDPKNDYYDAKVHVLSEQIKHHVHEEEAFIRGMFSKSRRTDVDMHELGGKLAGRKAELTAKYKKTLPKPAFATFATVKA
jgi:hemerythrin superfamily protein